MPGLRRYDKRVKYAYFQHETRSRKARALVYAITLREQPKQLTWWQLFKPVQGILQNDQLEFQKILDSLVRTGKLFEFYDRGKVTYAATGQPTQVAIDVKVLEKEKEKKTARAAARKMKRTDGVITEKKEKNSPVIKRTEEIDWSVNEF